MKIFHDIEQGSPEWIELRKGRPTASGFDRIITAAKGDLSKAAVEYIDELNGECFCPDWEYWSGNFFTDRGKEFEEMARECFQLRTGHDVRQVGFCISDDGVSGCSPDSLLYCDGEPFAGLEIKCPAPKAHAKYTRLNALPDEYKQQVHGSMAVTGLNEWHFFSYFPGVAPVHVIVKRDEYTAKVEKAIADFVAQYKAVRAEVMPRLFPNPAK